MTLRALAVLGLSLACAACGTSPDRYLLGKYAKQDTLAAFRICKNYGCSAQAMVDFSPAEWGQVRAAFMPEAMSAPEEREQIRHAVAMLETLVGPKAGTSGDKAGADIVSFDHEGQLDCIDEAFNTTTYLRLLARQGLLHWHDVGEPMERGSIIDRWPHNTATIVEHGTVTAYTVDSWFHANGMMPETVPLKDWLAGWSPPRA